MEYLTLLHPILPQSFHKIHSTTPPVPNNATACRDFSHSTKIFSFWYKFTLNLGQKDYSDSTKQVVQLAYENLMTGYNVADRE